MTGSLEKLFTIFNKDDDDDEEEGSSISTGFASAFVVVSISGALMLAGEEE